MKEEQPFFGRPRIVSARGARACEQALLADVDRILHQLGSLVLERPIYLLVPSHSLRVHLLDQLIRNRQHSLAGIGCWTLRGFALEVVERLGGCPPPGGRLLPILARRFARRERALRDTLDHLRDGYGAVVGAVTDLLEAGLDPAHEEALLESLTAEGRQVASAEEIKRARAVIRTAIAVQKAMERLGLGHVSSLLRRATEMLRTAEEPLHTSGVLVHGFADATGVATDFLETLLARLGGTLYLERPSDLSEPEREDPGSDFGRRFRERLLALAPAETAVDSPPSPASVALFRAFGAQTEVREVARRIRRLIEGGAGPEGIGVVARRLEPFRSALRTHLRRLGVPFSSLGALGPQRPAGRKIQALLELVTQRQRVRVDRWLDARGEHASGLPVFDLRLALFGLGAGHLDEVAALDLEKAVRGDTYPLPVRRGYDRDDESDAPVRLTRRKVPAESLRRARRDARQLCELFEAWKSCRGWSAHLQFVDELLLALGWSEERDPLAEVQLAMGRMSAGLPEDLQLDLDELTMLLSDELCSAGLDRFGGRGGGVQILDVIEARGRTFEHLFVVGLNKGVFPRVVREDPVLPDSLRQTLGREGHGVLPDLARKLAGYAEERFLFAQLLSASPRVTLSWQLADDDHHELIASPLVERLLWARTLDDDRQPEPPLARSAVALGGPDAELAMVRTPYEHALRAAHWGSRQQLQDAFEEALAAAGAPDPRPIAEARVRILSELDRGPGGEGRLGPYFGFLGPAVDASDPRLGQRLYVTTLERFAQCPWRTFLERLLRLEAQPDPLDFLPGLDPALVGQLVHRVLERVVADQLQDQPASLGDVPRRSPLAATWPSETRLGRIVRLEAAAAAREQGIDWQGFAEVLAEIALPYFDQARELLWEDPDRGRPVAVELDGSLQVISDSRSHTLYFKADRIDAAEDGLVLSDYKTSRRGISQAKTQKTRDRHLLASIRAGRLLQAVAYSQAAGGADDRGRYVFVRPEFDSPAEARVVVVKASDRQLRQAFESAVDALLRAWRQGAFFPRLVEADADKEPRACEYCAVAEACLRGDSGARGRLRDWAALRRGSTPAEKALLQAWWLASKKGHAGDGTSPPAGSAR